MTGLTAVAALSSTAWSVVLAVLPLAVLFTAFQLLFLRLPRAVVIRIALGTVMAAVGLFLFLLGVAIAFLPFGRVIGEALGALPGTWALAPFGVVLGFVTTWGEPSVRILAEQVEEASTGSIPRSLVLYAVCIGVALSVGLGMLRIAHAIPLQYLVVPGYGLVILIMWFSERAFVSIAVDAGGVATGPVANTFLLALAFGTSAALGGQDPLLHGLGLVALVSLAPVISVMALGIIVGRRAGRKE